MLLSCLVALAAETTAVRFEALSSGTAEVVAEATWLGTDSVVKLEAARGPTLPGGGRILKGEMRGDSVRLLPVRLYSEKSGERTLLWEGLEPLVLGDNVISFVVDGERARRVSVAATSMERENQFAAGRAAGIGWIVVTALYVAWLARSSRR